MVLFSLCPIQFLVFSLLSTNSCPDRQAKRYTNAPRCTATWEYDESFACCVNTTSCCLSTATDKGSFTASHYHRPCGIGVRWESIVFRAKRGKIKYASFGIEPFAIGSGRKRIVVVVTVPSFVPFTCSLIVCYSWVGFPPPCICGASGRGSWLMCSFAETVDYIGRED